MLSPERAIGFTMPFNVSHIHIGINVKLAVALPRQHLISQCRREPHILRPRQRHYKHLFRQPSLQKYCHQLAKQLCHAEYIQTHLCCQLGQSVLCRNLQPDPRRSILNEINPAGCSNCAASWVTDSFVHLHAAENQHANEQKSTHSKAAC